MKKIQEVSAALVCLLGAGLAGYSVLVKLAAVPCFSASCGAVINSSYGAIAGVPVGLLGLVLWGIVPWLPPAGIRLVKAVLVAGSVFFVLIQAVVLKRFCPVCLGHAAACFAIAPLPIPRRLTAATVYAGLVLAFVVAFGTDQWSRSRLMHGAERLARPTAEARQAAAIPGLPWLSPEPLESARLVVSLSCGQCQRILGELVSAHSVGRQVAPVLFLSEEGNDEVTRIAVAAVLSAPADERVGRFTGVLAVLLQDPAILARDDAETAAFLLGTLAPDLEALTGKADTVLQAHAEALALLGIDQTPAVVVDGIPGPYSLAAVVGD